MASYTESNAPGIPKWHMPRPLIPLVALLHGAGILAGSLILAFLISDTPLWAKISYISLSSLTVLATIPMWSVLLRYKKPVVLDPKDYSAESPSRVDVAVTTYKEDIDEIAGTLNAVMAIEWTGLRIFILDDAGRDDVEQLCEAARGPHQVFRVTRNTNAGRKGGNMNNWIETCPDPAPFFLTLDADMRPFPDCLALIFTHLESMSEYERERTAFLQTPQYFRNFDVDRDPFDVCNMQFIHSVAPCMDVLRIMPYIGTGALWRREALVRSDGYIETHATEDVVTGCRVHRKGYVSRYIARPIAAGISPRTLPELIEQHIRWNTGLIQMAAYHRFYIFASGLRPLQRLGYLGTCGGWMFALIHFLVLMGAALLANITLIITEESTSQDVGWRVVAILVFLISFGAWHVAPGATPSQRLRGTRIAFVYFPTIFLAIARAMGIGIQIRAASESSRSRWHPVMYFHATVALVMLSTSIAAIARGKPEGIVQGVVTIISWTYLMWPIVISLAGGTSEERLTWTDLEENRPNLGMRTFSKDDDARALAQLKQTVVELWTRLEKYEQDSERTPGESASEQTSSASAGLAV